MREADFEELLEAVRSSMNDSIADGRMQDDATPALRASAGIVRALFSPHPANDNGLAGRCWPVPGTAGTASC